MKIRAEAYTHIQNIFRQLCINISPKDLKNKTERRSLIDRVDDQKICRVFHETINQRTLGWGCQTGIAIITIHTTFV